jgi:hypothetical protein
VKKGDKGGQKLTIDVKGAEVAADSVARPLRVTLGGVLPSARAPKIRASPGKGVWFGEISGNPGEHAAATELIWGFNVAMHLPDDDTFMENIPAVVDQVRSVRAFARKARIRIEPVTFNSPYPRSAPDPRCQGAFGAAWVVRMVKYLGCAGVDEAGFDVGTGAAAVAVQEMAKHAGSPLLSTAFDGGGVSAAVDVFAIEADDKRQIWAVNLTDEPQAVTIAGLGAGAAVRVGRGGAEDTAEPKPQTTTAKGEIMLDLVPFEICRLRVGK